jgi:hypothetical protein
LGRRSSSQSGAHGPGPALARDAAAATGSAINPKKQIFNCRGCATGGDVISLARLVHDWDFIEAVEFVNGQSIKEARQTTPAERTHSAEEAGKAAFVRKKIEAIVRELVPVLGSPGERHLREERRIDTGQIADLLGSIHAIGWHPAVYFHEPGHPLHGQRLGCIVGVMTDPITARLTGAVSRTYVHEGRKVCKAKTLGEGGGVVRLSRDEDVHEGLLLGEGIETCLAAATLSLRPIWSTGSGTTMGKFPVLAGIECLTLFADHDANGAGERAARVTEARWLAAGRKARVILPDRTGDINDALRESGP